MVRYTDIGTLGLTALLVFATPVRAEGDPARGAELIRDSDKGNCTICHVIPGLGLAEEMQGDLGPALDGIGAHLGSEDLRTLITDPRLRNPDTIMPAYGVSEGLFNVASAYVGQPILTGDEIIDIVTYLIELK